MEVFFLVRPWKSFFLSDKGSVFFLSDHGVVGPQGARDTHGNKW